MHQIHLMIDTSSLDADTIIKFYAMRDIPK